MRESLRSYHVGDLRAADDGNTVTAVISTGDLARDGAIIEAAGWDFDHFRSNPVVLWGHDDSEPPIGVTTDIRIEGDRVVATAEIDADDPRGATVLRKVRNGNIRATSVRWNPLKVSTRQVEVDGKKRDVTVFERQELLEWSFVSIPADPGALILRAATNTPLDFAELSTPPAPDNSEISIADAARLLTAQVADTDSERLDAEERAVLAGLHRELSELLEARAEPRSDDSLLALSGALSEAIAELRKPRPAVDVTGVIAGVLERATGRTDIRKLMETHA